MTVVLEGTQLLLALATTTSLQVTGEEEEGGGRRRVSDSAQVVKELWHLIIQPEPHFEPRQVTAQLTLSSEHSLRLPKTTHHTTLT